MPVMKEVSAKWFVDMANYISSNPHVIVNGFICSGITAAFDGKIDGKIDGIPIDTEDNTSDDDGDNISTTTDSGSESSQEDYADDEQIVSKYDQLH